MNPKLKASLLCAGLVGASGCGLVPVEADWTTDATAHRGRPQGQDVLFECPPNGEAGTVWGTDVYTDDSSVCTAGVHAGQIEFATGGVFRIQIAEGLDGYTGSERNGVISLDYGPFENAFRVRQ